LSFRKEEGKQAIARDIDALVRDAQASMVWFSRQGACLADAFGLTFSRTSRTNCGPYLIDE
jgi:hypothetical protein